MALFETAMLFPHVKQPANRLAALGAIFDRTFMLVLDGTADTLPGNIRAVSPDPAVTLDLVNAYDGLKQFGDQVLSENTSPGDYTAFDPQKPPLYDREAMLGLLAEFQSGTQKGAAPERDELYRSAALALMLSEDVACLQVQALNVLKNADEQSAYMWEELKGEPDPLQLQTRDIELDLVDNRFVKKRLTAWGILARIHSVDAGVYVTFDRATLEQCLETFEPDAPFKEVAAAGGKASFYSLPVDHRGFLNALIRPDADLELDNNAQVVLCYVNLTD